MRPVFEELRHRAHRFHPARPHHAVAHAPGSRMFAKPVTEIAGRGLAMQWPSQPTCALTLLLDHSILDGAIGHGDRTGKDSGQKVGR